MSCLMFKSLSHFLFFAIYVLFIYFWLHWIFVALCGLSLVAVSGVYSSLRCTGFSLRWLLLLWSTGSRRTGFSSCGAWAQLLCGMWDLPGPGLESMSPALAHRFLTTVPPRKSPLSHFEFIFVYGVRVSSNVIDLHVAVQLSQHHVLKRLSFLHCTSVPPLLKINCPQVCGFISGLSVLFH